MVLFRDFADFELYYQGTWDDAIFKKCVAVVGSRRMTEYRRRTIADLGGAENILPLHMAEALQYRVQMT